jgi:MOSC domain-containing protein YiiM
MARFSCIPFIIIHRLLSVDSFVPRRPAVKNSYTISSWQDSLSDVFGLNQKEDSPGKDDVDDAVVGKVVRIAARAYDKEHSKPSSAQYTTRKNEFPSLHVTKMGLEGDYNHYRTLALHSTKDRAISILTTDVMKSLRVTYGKYQMQEGDLGENILVDGVTFRFFRVGQYYQFTTTTIDKDSESRVVIEITEPVEPCANLCKLPYINDDSIEPKQRIERCKDFIDHLDRFDGYRGWYAKVHDEGSIGIGARVSLVVDDS